MGIALGELNAELEARGACTLPVLAERIAQQDEREVDTVRHWVNENAADLAEQTNSTFVPGVRRRSGRFERPTPNI